MKIINSKVHGISDYLFGALLIASPWLFNFYHGGTESILPVIMGIITIVYSMITDYELGILKELPFRFHLKMDLIAGILLLISPWLFRFQDEVFLPHTILGAIELTVFTLSSKETYFERERLI